MKVLKASEVLTGIEQSIRKKEQEQEQLLSLRDSMHKVIDLDDALKGEGGAAIKEYFKVLHIPVLLLLNQFLDQYIKSLKDIQMNVRNYETEDGVVREDFITTEVKNGLDRAVQVTQDSVGTINDRFMGISDLIGGSPVSTSQFDSQVDGARSHNQKTIEDLKTVDEENTSKLDEPANELQGVRHLVSKIQGWSKSGIFLNSQEINEVTDYYLKTDSLRDMIIEGEILSAPINSTMGGNHRSIDSAMVDSAKFGALATMQRVKNNLTVSNPQASVPEEYRKSSEPMLGNGLETLGLVAGRPVKSGSTLMQNIYGASQAAKHAKIKALGGSVRKETYFTAQGEQRFRLRLTKPELFGVKKNTYTGYNTNQGKVADVRNLVDGKSSFKNSFKGVAGKVGYLGIGLSAISDVTYGFNHNQSGSQIAGNVVSSTTVGVVSIASSAYLGGKLVHMQVLGQVLLEWQLVSLLVWVYLMC
ncbi:LXG domain-containing protein [Halobacillus shinanisalinarum]|uniref:LXG domain-containing protein n=1 Tax=Halobacillus shinanisalinarum TaxID=2932258 RepID=A0ABY4H294_9BACI|nr:LXG domain-containing protein [Halobacillus shinanisalinarum]UOQ94570.1 LXG domain-containing protein [Halobacillus shinanisalinarum]